MSMNLLVMRITDSISRDQKSNYLEGWLCIMVYVAIAVAAFYFPEHEGTEGESTTTTTTEVVEHIAAKLLRP
jgi:Ca2+:H+ antiporter